MSPNIEVQSAIIKGNNPIEEIRGMVLKTVDIIKANIVRRGFWQKPVEEQEVVLNQILSELNACWGTHFTLSVDINDRMYGITGGGTFDNGLITIHKVSLMTFIHEFAHGICPHGDELAARHFSHKIFSMALPRTYREGVERGRFFHTVDVEAIQI